MAMMILRDDALWTGQILGDPEVAALIASLPAGAPVTLRIAGTPIRFHKMEGGPDGRPLPGLTVDAAHAQAWAALRQEHAGAVPLEIEGSPKRRDPYLESLSAMLDEWNSPEDAEAFDDL
ncbi:hypothetical protein [Methylobacterium indicum]|uniref:Uncharacterized protein n=1 Tax=Methylobacterium indicum TaxID=1775910 RepID=A0ABR5HJD8_9HYPH|nr:hypothetical protein [Methylobacterium indicum]KMO26879.1 hypothetical protein QR79_00290 [Methylobacterium indicum]